MKPNINKDNNMYCVEKLNQELEKGVPFEEALSSLRKQNFSPVQTIYAIHKVKKVNLGEAKEIFAKSKAWHDVAVAADEWHQKLIDALENEGNVL